MNISTIIREFLFQQNKGGVSEMISWQLSQRKDWLSAIVTQITCNIETNKEKPYYILRVAFSPELGWSMCRGYRLYLTQIPQRISVIRNQTTCWLCLLYTTSHELSTQDEVINKNQILTFWIIDKWLDPSILECSNFQFGT